MLLLVLSEELKKQKTFPVNIVHFSSLCTLLIRKLSDSFGNNDSHGTMIPRWKFTGEFSQKVYHTVITTAADHSEPLFPG
jgi:hypothetical protein